MEIKVKQFNIIFRTLNGGKEIIEVVYATRWKLMLGLHTVQKPWWKYTQYRNHGGNWCPGTNDLPDV